MEQNNLENEIREQLRKREIQPSLPAWDRLDAMLSYQETKLKKKSFPWMKIAAGMILFLGVSYFFLTSNEKKVQKQDAIVVEAEQESKVYEQELKTNTINANSSNKSVKEEGLQTLVYTDSKVIKKHDAIEKVSGVNNKTATVVEAREVEKQLATVDVAKEESVEVTKVEVQHNNVLVTDVKIAQKPKLKVDPNTLLKQVDGEIQLTFRQKVMKTISKGYKEAKEVVASRNQESSINY